MSSPPYAYSWLPSQPKEWYNGARHRALRINRAALWLGLTIAVVFSLHSILRVVHPQYATFTSLASAPKPAHAVSEFIPHGNDTRRANAALVMLVRNSELDGALSSVSQLEQRFNRRFGYPWIFLNDVPFSDEFKSKMSRAIAGPVAFGLVPKEHWQQPDWIDEDKAAASRAEMATHGVPYAGSVSYRNMCRYNSGFFYRHPLMQNYKWYWRVEPGVNFYCDTDYDPFLFMEANDKVYGFTISLHDWPLTMPTLWDAVKEFVAANPALLPHDNSMGFLSDDGGNTYTTCHFWSNFEIADMDFWRGDAYSKFFAHLESKGGFYYERWGDAPVHSIGAGLFARRDQVHFFEDVGYYHEPFTHCPQHHAEWLARNCSCPEFPVVDNHPDSCLRKWEDFVRR